MQILPMQQETLPPLKYGFDALEPHIDAQTMHLHYEKHFNAYMTNLNKVLPLVPQATAKDTDHLMTLVAEHSLKNATLLTKEQDQTLRNHGGGFVNHRLYFDTMTPGGSPLPDGPLKASLMKQFGDMDAFKKLFLGKAAAVFGSGWVFLVKTASGLEIVSTQNQDTPAFANVVGKSILALDVWEHVLFN